MWSAAGTVGGCGLDGPGLEYRHGQESSLSLPASIPTLCPSQASFKCVVGLLYPGVTGQDVRVYNSLNLLARLRMIGAILLRPSLCVNSVYQNNLLF
jgi:hypothetical protein